MLELLKKHQKKILIILFIITLIRFINLIGVDKDYNPVEGMAINLLRMPLALVNTIQDLSKSTFRVVVDYKNVKEENQYLKDKVDELLYKQKQLEKVIKQNQRLRKLLNFKEYVPYQIVGASVISHSMDNWSNVLMIDRGKKDGIRRKMPVVAKEGYLVGVIQGVTSHTAQVMLLNDSNFVTGGLIRREESRDLGLVKGQTQENKLVMNNLSWDADIRVGDIIVTSGLSENYPKGLPIGKVTSVTPEDYGLTQAANLLPFVELNKIEELLVITNFSTKRDVLLPPLDSHSKLEEEAH